MPEFYIYSGDVQEPKLVSTEAFTADTAQDAIQAWVSSVRPNPSLDYWAVDRSAITHAQLTVTEQYQVTTSGI